MQSSPIRVGFLRAYALPAIWLFALPAFALWFSGHAMGRFDQQFLEFVEPQIEKAADLSAEQKQNALAYYRALPASLVCISVDPELSDYRESLGESCSDAKQYGWIRDLSLASLWLGGGSVLFMILCAAASFVSRQGQYLSFVLGWNVLKLVGAAQTILQGALAVFLSYWMTALWMQRYVPKLIAIAGIIALIAVYKVVVAIFRRVLVARALGPHSRAEQRDRYGAAEPGRGGHRRQLLRDRGRGAPGRAQAEGAYALREPVLAAHPQALRGRGRALP
jgi:hypothetical protein